MSEQCSVSYSMLAHFAFAYFFSVVMTELSVLFPSIPLVAEEDSAFLRSNDLVKSSVVIMVTDITSFKDKQLTEVDVLDAIDRGGKDAFTFGPKPATYWVSLCMHFYFNSRIGCICKF